MGVARAPHKYCFGSYDILWRARLFLAVIAYAALIASVISTLMTGSSRKAWEMATVAILASWWGVRLCRDRAEWFDLVIDFALLLLFTAMSSAPPSTAGVYFSGLLFRSMYEGRLEAIARPFVFSGALASGVLANSKLFLSSSADLSSVFAILFPLLLTGVIATSLAQLILRHEMVLQQQSNLIDLTTSTVVERDHISIASNASRAVEKMLSVTTDHRCKPVILVTRDVRIDAITSSGLVSTFPINSPDAPETSDLVRAARIIGNDFAARNQNRLECTLITFSKSDTARGAISIYTTTRPAQILLKGLEIAADHIGLLIEVSDLNRKLKTNEIRRIALLDQVLERSDEQRSALANRLHDGPIQSLTALGLEIDFASELIRSEEIDEGLSVLHDVKRDLCAEIGCLRNTMNDLLPPILSERGLEKALRDLVRQQAATYKSLQFQFASAMLKRPPASLERLIYRVCEEALANAIRHACASTISVTVDGDLEELEIVITDDGMGFDAGNANHLIEHQQFGVVLMQHVMEMIGGALDISSNDHEGTRVMIHAPISPRKVSRVVTSVSP